MSTKIADLKPEEAMSLDDLTEKLVQKIKETTPEPLLYDLGSGKNKRAGFLGVDFYYDGADVQHDLFHEPWAFAPDGGVDCFNACHILEHAPDWFFFWGEAWRKLKPGGYVLVTVPYGNSARAYQDPDHKRFIFFETFWYLNKQTRQRIGADHYAVKQYGADVDFEIVHQLPAWNEDFLHLGEAQRGYHIRHTFNAVDDITVLLRKPEDKQ